MNSNKSAAISKFKSVNSFEELTNTALRNETNAVCWERNLLGDFKEIVYKLQLKENITNISISQLQALNLSPQGDLARNMIIEDYRLLADFGAIPSINLLKNYERDDELDVISTDVYSFHVDRSPIPTDTFLCTYFGATSDILPNHQAIQKIKIPEIRKKLRGLFDGADEEFETFLTENYFDLHYQALPDATQISLGIGNLWRLAVDHPTQQVAPCIHRAPKENDGEYRLLIIC